MQYLIEFWEYIKDFNALSVVIRLVLSILVGGIIGNERGKHGSAAGLRTHILVCIGSAMTSLTSLYAIEVLGFQGDVFRISSQVISGIGFLGAGMIIIKNSSVITGLTTAAGMWATASIGVALGYGFYLGALIAMLACVFTAVLLKRLERKRKMSIHIYAEISQPEKAGDICDFVHQLAEGDVQIEISPAKSNITGNIGIHIIAANSQDDIQFRKQIEALEGISFVVPE